MKEVEAACKAFKESNKQEDYRLIKNRKNTLLRETKREKKKYFKKRMELGLGKWKTTKELTKEEDRSLVKAVVNNKVETSPRKLAQEFTKHLINKLLKIRNI